MKVVTDSVPVPSPNHSPNEFLDYELECRATLKPLLVGLIDKVEAAGWARRTAASTLMYLAAQHVSSKRTQPSDPDHAREARETS